jgi:Uncharacterized stress protein (general stress protein 26)
MLRPVEITATRILGNVNEVFLSSVGEGGSPRSSIVTKLRADGFSTIYFAAPADSHKVQNFRQNPSASVCYYSNCDSITLMGKIEFIEDAALKHQLWLECQKKSHYSGVNEYDFCPMRFTTVEATFWIANRLSTYQY